MTDEAASLEEVWEMGHAFADPHTGRNNLVGKGRVAITEVRDDNASLRAFRRSSEAVRSVWLNVQDFLKSIVEYAAFFEKKRALNHEQLDAIAFDLGRRLLNILSMYRSMLDHSNKSIKRRFGEASEQWTQWEVSLNKEYDELFEYRLLERLRNYAQHVGVPPIAFQFSASAHERPVAIRIDLQRDALLEERSIWNARLLADLRECPPLIPLIETLDRWSAAFWRIAGTLQQIEKVAARNSAMRVLGRRAQYGIPEGIGEICGLCIKKAALDGASIDCRLEHINERWAYQVVYGEHRENSAEASEPERVVKSWMWRSTKAQRARRRLLNFRRR
jgi:hypothetical protein